MFVGETTPTKGRGLLGSVANMFSITVGESPTTFNALNDALAALTGEWGNPSSTVPEAYINMVFVSNNGLDTYMMYDGITASAFGTHEQLNVAYEASTAGVVYIYVANENSETGDVWFDDLLIIHEQTTSSLNVAQTNDYYPFGMVMEGTAYNDESRQAQLYKFNGNEVLEGNGLPTTLNLMNFNARLYNPALGVFLAVDPMATSFAGLTPYNFGFNNPTLLSDPNGECPVCPFLIILAKAAVTGAAIGGAGYTASVAFSNGGFQNWNWGQFGSAVGMGAAAGVVTAGIGSAFGAVGSAGIGGEIGRAFAHGYSNMMLGAAFGQDPTLASFASGALGSLAGSALHKAGTFAQIGGSSLVGGVGAELSGGDFWRGAATGATVASLNHAVHGTIEGIKNAKVKKSWDGPVDLSDDTEVYRNVVKAARYLRLYEKGKLDVSGKITMQDLFDFSSIDVENSHWSSLDGGFIKGVYHWNRGGDIEINLQSSYLNMHGVDARTHNYIQFLEWPSAAPASYRVGYIRYTEYYTNWWKNAQYYIRNGKNL